MSFGKCARGNQFTPEEENELKGYLGDESLDRCQQLKNWIANAERHLAELETFKVKQRKFIEVMKCVCKSKRRINNRARFQQHTSVVRGPDSQYGPGKRKLFHTPRSNFDDDE